MVNATFVAFRSPREMFDLTQQSDKLCAPVKRIATQTAATTHQCRQCDHCKQVQAMTDIYRASLRAKYDSLTRVLSCDMGLGDDLTALSEASLELVHNGAEQAILEWASRRAGAGEPLRPLTNLQHLLNEYCAIADHL